MHELPLSQEFVRFAADPASTLDGGLLVTRVVDAAADIAWIRAELERHAAACPRPTGAAALVDYLRSAGFAGATDYYLTRNSSLEFVLRERKGIPISMALVVLGIAEALSLPAHGVNFPGHFLVRVDNDLVDPFNLVVVDAGERADWAAQRGLDGDAALAPAAPVAVVLRMLNNLRVLAEQASDHARALDYIGYQILVAPEPLPFHLERIDLWVAAGVPEMACRELDTALALTRDESLRAALAARRLELEQSPDRLH